MAFTGGNGFAMATQKTKKRSFLDVYEWVRRFEADPLEVLNIRDDWMTHAVSHISDLGYAPPDGEFRGMTEVLIAWADRTNIEGAGVLWEFYRQLNAAWKPGVPYGQRQPSEVIEETMSKALGVINRITNRAIIACKETYQNRKRRDAGDDRCGRLALPPLNAKDREAIKYIKEQGPARGEVVARVSVNRRGRMRITDLKKIDKP